VVAAGGSWREGEKLDWKEKGPINYSFPLCLSSRFDVLLERQFVLALLPSTCSVCVCVWMFILPERASGQRPSHLSQLALHVGGSSLFVCLLQHGQAREGRKERERVRP